MALGEIGLAHAEEAEPLDEARLASTLESLGLAYVRLGDANRSIDVLERALLLKERLSRRALALAVTFQVRRFRKVALNVFVVQIWLFSELHVPSPCV